MTKETRERGNPRMNDDIRSIAYSKQDLVWKKATESNRYTSNAVVRIEDSESIYRG